MAEALNGLSTLSPEELDILFSSLTEKYTPIEINEQVYMIPTAVNDLIDNWINKDEVEFVSEFARPVPQIVLANVLGFPLDDIPLLAEWGKAQVAPYVYGKGHMNVLNQEQAEEQFKLLDESEENIKDNEY